MKVGKPEPPRDTHVFYLCTEYTRDYMGERPRYEWPHSLTEMQNRAAMAQPRIVRRWIEWEER